MASQQKIMLVMSGLSLLELVCTWNDFPHGVDFVVDNISCRGCLIIAAVKMGRCHCMGEAFSSNHWVKR